MALSRVKEHEHRTRAMAMAMGIEVVDFLSLMRSCDLIWRLADWDDGVWYLCTCIGYGISAWSMALCFSTLVFSFKELLSGFFVKQKSISMKCAE